ncbi:MAG: prolyl oligopeptidase family serine peptidase [Oscillospiraceae bacterium]|jgi:predicted peptidase|nr:prolyl oligopeptidase family serine peptidase [Oscillospiraceae bacterium]
MRLKKERRECFICIPQCPLFFEYNTNEFSAVLGDLINALCDEHLNIDRTRVYLLGVSYGGHAVTYECLRHPERYAAAIPTVAWTYVAGLDFQANTYLYGIDEYHRPFDENGYFKLAQTPLWLAYSHLEVQYNEPLSIELKAIDAPVKTTRIDRRGHAMFTLFFRDEPWTDWLFAQQKEI